VKDDMPGSYETLIVGAGIAGLTVARALERHDMSVDIIERRTHPATGKGFFLPANAVRALTALGFDAPLDILGTPLTSQDLRDSSGDPLGRIHLGVLWHHIADSVGITHSTLHDALSKNVQAVPRTGLSVASLQEDPEGALVTFTDGTSRHYDLVIGADGLHSQIRTTVSPHTTPQYTGQVCWRYLTDNHHGIDQWTVWMGRGTSFLAVPVSTGQLYCYADMSMPTPPAQNLTLTSQAHHFTGYAPEVKALMNTPDAEQAHFARIETVSTDQWATKHTVLVGDAAHATPPNMAQGVAMAAEDALVLAETLTEPGTDLAHALTRYQQRRQPRTTWIQDQTRKRDRTRNLTPALRNFVLRRAADRLYNTAFGPLRETP
jgi:2-polyprenyl-6-methoxyphenol hydroxylase-like FAD-dependent oxidoreductase